MFSGSVYELIGDLVQELGREFGGKPSDTAVKKCKYVAFGILLGKQPAALGNNGDHSALERRLIQEEPIEMLHCHLFHMQLRTRYRFQKQRCDRFERLLDELKLEPKRETGGIIGERETELLQFLLLLRDSVPDGGELGNEVFR